MTPAEHAAKALEILEPRWAYAHLRERITAACEAAAADARAEEREACAAVCEAARDEWDTEYDAALRPGHPREDAVSPSVKPRGGRKFSVSGGKVRGG